MRSVERARVQDWQRIHVHTYARVLSVCAIAAAAAQHAVPAFYAGSPHRTARRPPSPPLAPWRRAGACTPRTPPRRGRRSAVPGGSVCMPHERASPCFTRVLVHTPGMMCGGCAARSQRVGFAEAVPRPVRPPRPATGGFVMITDHTPKEGGPAMSANRAGVANTQPLARLSRHPDLNRFFLSAVPTTTQSRTCEFVSCKTDRKKNEREPRTKVDKLFPQTGSAVTQPGFPDPLP